MVRVSTDPVVHPFDLGFGISAGGNGLSSAVSGGDSLDGEEDECPLKRDLRRVSRSWAGGHSRRSSAGEPRKPPFREREREKKRTKQWMYESETHGGNSEINQEMPTQLAGCRFR